MNRFYSLISAVLPILLSSQLIASDIGVSCSFWSKYQNPDTAVFQVGFLVGWFDGYRYANALSHESLEPIGLPRKMAYPFDDTKGLQTFIDVVNAVCTDPLNQNVPVSLLIGPIRKYLIGDMSFEQLQIEIAKVRKW